MKLLKLTNGMLSQVDDEDFERLSQWRWTFGARGYAHRRERIGGRNRIIMLHRAVLGLTDPAVKADHVDGDHLNNQKSNLRRCTQAQNNRNRSIQRNNPGQFKGVVRRRHGWVGNIRSSGRQRQSRQMATAAEAAEWYDKMAIELHGEFAKTNRSMGLL